MMIASPKPQYFAIGKKTFYLLLCVLFLHSTAKLSAQQLAFPTAEGWGKYAVGGRGGKVIEVTNLEDSGPGSLRAAISESGPRTIVFRVSGNIELKNPLKVLNPYVTIAGQTAPGDGICLKGNYFSISTDEVIVRYIRVRLGDLNEALESDAFDASGCKNVIIDHVSTSWSVDETMSIYDGVENLTVQWSIISESLRYSNHSKGAHGYGGIWGGHHTTFHHNLLAHHSSRNPRWDRGIDEADSRNNVIYNWTFNSCYGGEGGENGPSKINMVANYYKAGPSTRSGEMQYRILNPSFNEYGFGYWYIADNYVYGHPEATEDNWTYGVQGVASLIKDTIRVDEPFPYMPINQHTPEVAYELVLDDAGCTLPRRDTIDKRIVWEVENGTALYGGQTGEHSGIIDSQFDVGGWPELYTGPVPVDSDHDGMPDEWETSMGLNKNDPEDRNGDLDNDGYTNLEEYLNSITVFPDFLVGPSNLTGELIGTNTIRLTWQDNTDDETGFELERGVDGSFSTIDVLDANTTSYTDSELDDLTVYQYRVRGFNNSLASAYTNVVEIATLSETSPPLKAEEPFPTDKANFVRLEPKLKWKAGLSAQSHDIYFGDSNPPPFYQNQADTFFIPPELEKAETYYWRIDEVNQNGTTRGTVWRFTTKRDLPNGNFGRWKFDESSGDVAIDVGGFGNDGYLVNMDYTARTEGIQNKALRFDGNDDYVYVPSPGLFDFAEESFSISFWFSPPETIPDRSMYLLQKGSFSTEQGHSGKWYGFEIKSDELRFSVDDNLIKTSAVISDIGSKLYDEWNNITGVRDDSTNQLKLYLNGYLAASANDLTGDISEDENLYFGNSYDLNTTLLGTMDDIRIFNYALSREEIADIVNEYITDADDEIVPETYALKLENYPNPFNPSTIINYTIPSGSRVKLEVYDMLGRNIATLIDEYKQKGKYNYNFDASELSSGIYIYVLSTAEKTISNKMMFLK